MTDIFDARIVCKNCNKEMEKSLINRKGLDLRAVKCNDCGEVIVHPADLNNLEHYNNLKGKTFHVKLRMVGNSHAVSIPKEIVDFFNDFNKQTKKDMSDMVKLCFEDFKKLSLIFDDWEDIKRNEERRYD